MTHNQFAKTLQVLELMRQFPQQWFILGGWAVDLFLGSETREHDDLEIGIYRSDQNYLRNYLQSWTFTKQVDGALEDWREGEWLETPIHEIHGTCRSGTDSLTTLEILLQDETDSEWKFRRNNVIHRAKDEVFLISDAGIPYLAPEIVLLYKAKQLREKDELDFALVLKNLTAAQRTWLGNSLEICHPNHSWLSRLQ